MSYASGTRLQLIEGGTIRQYQVQTPGTNDFFIGGTAFDATKPVICIDKNLAAATYTKKNSLLRLKVTQVGTVAGGFISFIYAFDSVLRRTSGGVEITVPKSPAYHAVSAPALTDEVAVWFSLVGGDLTTVAASSDVTYWGQDGAPASLGRTDTFDFDGETWIEEKGSILVYAFAAVTPPTCRFTLELIEKRKLR